MKHISFADAEYAGKRKRTRREIFLSEMDKVVPWKGLIALIEPQYRQRRRGPPGVSVDGHVAGPFDAKLVRLQRPGDGRVAL